MTATIWWGRVIRGQSGAPAGEWIEINIVALALPVVVWLLIELRRFAPHRAAATAVNATTNLQIAPIHRIVTRLSLIALAVVVVGRLAVTAVPIAASLSPVAWPEWLALVAAGIAAIACLWDAGSPGDSPGAKTVAALYGYGLLVAGVWLDYLHLEPKWLWWSGDIVLAAYALATSCLWWRRAGLRAIADRLRIPRGDDSPQAGLQWLEPLNCALVVLVVVLSYSFVLSFDDYKWRLLAAEAVLFQTATVGLLAQGQRRWRLQYFSLVLGALGAVASRLGGARSARRQRLAPESHGGRRGGPGHHGGRVRSRTGQAAACRKRLAAGGRAFGPTLVAFDAVAILCTLGFEGMEVVNTGHVAMAPAAMITIVVVLIGLFVACLASAVLPGRDPLGLSDRGRTAYVYAAEATLALLFVHIRLTKPEWFHGFFAQYWPIIVQGIAFVGVGVGEWFRRRRWVVVGEPLATTGAFLPLLPVIGFWVLPTRVDYSLLLLTVGARYGAMSVAQAVAFWLRPARFGRGELAACGIFCISSKDLDFSTTRSSGSSRRRCACWRPRI